MNKTDNFVYRGQSSKDRNKTIGWNMIKELGRDINIKKDVIHEACNLLNAVEENPNLKGKKMILKVASVIMIASRKSHLPKNMKDILKGADITKKELSRCYRLILRKVCKNMNTNLKPSQCITQIATGLRMKGDLEEKCKEVAEYLRKREILTGRSPFTVASAAVYMVTQVYGELKCSFKDIAVVAQLSDATIRNAFKILYPYR